MIDLTLFLLQNKAHNIINIIDNLKFELINHEDL